MAHYAGEPGLPAWGDSVDSQLSVHAAGLASIPDTYVSKDDAGDSVQSYGATGDGLTDDTAAIAAAVTAAAAANRALYFPAGTYMVSSTVTIPSGMRIMGVPGKSIIKATAANTSNPLTLDVFSASNVLISGLTFDGNQALIASFNPVSRIYSSTRVRFESCTWQNTRGIGVAFTTNVSYSGVAWSHFSEVGSYNKVSGLSTDRRQGITFSTGTKANNVGNYAVGNSFTEVGLDCVSASSQTDVLIASNRVHGNYAGALYVSGSSFARVIGNHIEGGDSSGNGVDVYSSDTVTVTGNTATMRGAAGIMLADTANSTITGNVCTNNYRGGTSLHNGGITIYAVSTPCSNITIAGNVCTDTQGTKTQAYGVQVSAAAHTGIRIDDSNQLSGNLTASVGGGGDFSPFTRTPTWISLTPGDATVKARYTTSRTRITESGSMTYGTTTSLAGSTVYLALPAAPHADIVTNGVIGHFSAFDTSASVVRTGTLLRSGSNAIFQVDNGGGTVKSTVPFTWATGDVLSWWLDYPPAAS